MTLQDDILETLSHIPDLSRQRLIVWGSGNMARHVYLIARSLAVQVAAFVDGTEETSGQSLFGQAILTPDQLQPYVEAGGLIVVASTWWREIGVDLINRGLQHGKHFLIVQRALSNVTWKGDLKDPDPVFIGRKTHTFEGLLAYYPQARPHYIGAFCSIAVGTRLAINHCHDAITSHPFITHSNQGILPVDRMDLYQPHNRPITIGNDVWLGYNACILPGVTIGNGAIVGAGAVVTKDVPPYAIVVGSPAKVIRYRFDDHQIALLEAVKWWTWSDRRLQKHVDDFRTPQRFFRLAEQIAASLTRRPFAGTPNNLPRSLPCESSASQPTSTTRPPPSLMTV